MHRIDFYRAFANGATRVLSDGVTAMALSVLGASQQVHAGPSGQAHRIEVVYSADNAVCGPTTAALSRIHRLHPRLIYVSNDRFDFFRLTGFQQPRWIATPEPDLGMELTEDPEEYATELRAEAPEFAQNDGGLWWGNGFFHADVVGDGKQRLLYVRHDALGHHGDFEEVVWILKPGAVFHFVQQKVEGRDGSYSTVDPTIVDLKVSFIDEMFDRRADYPLLGRKRLGFPDVPTASSTARRIVPSYFVGSQSPAQQPFLVNGRLYVLAGTPFINAGLVLLCHKIYLHRSDTW